MLLRSLTHVYVLALDNSLSDVLATRDKASDGAGYIVLLQDTRDDFCHRDGAERSGGRRLPNGRVARCHRDREIPAYIHSNFRVLFNKEASIPAIYSNGEVERGQDAKDSEGIRNWKDG
jgi:hypothetical protein